MSKSHVFLVNHYLYVYKIRLKPYFPFLFLRNVTICSSQKTEFFFQSHCFLVSFLARRTSLLFVLFKIKLGRLNH